MGYMDNSGLYVKIGTEVATPQAGGEYNNLGALRQVEIVISDMTKITTTDAIIIGTDNITFPKGVKIEKVAVIVDTAATGASAALNIGFVAQDRTTVVATDAILSGALGTTMTIGQELTYTKSTATTGSQVGTGVATLAPYYLSYKWTGGAFTAGAIRVRIDYYRP